MLIANLYAWLIFHSHMYVAVQNGSLVYACRPTLPPHGVPEHINDQFFIYNIYIYIYMCVYINICIGACTYPTYPPYSHYKGIYIYIYIYTYICLCTYTRVYIYIYIYIYAYMYLCMYVCM